MHWILSLLTAFPAASLAALDDGAYYDLHQASALFERAARGECADGRAAAGRKVSRLESKALDPKLAALVAELKSAMASGAVPAAGIERLHRDVHALQTREGYVHRTAWHDEVAAACGSKTHFLTKAPATGGEQATN